MRTELQSLSNLLQHRIIALVVVSAGCASSPGTVKPAAPPSSALAEASQSDLPDTMPTPIEEVPVRERKAFEAAISAYDEARKDDLSSEECESVADKFATVYASYPRLIQAKFNQGLIYEECGLPGRAKAIYEEILKTKPQFGPALNNLGEMAYRAGKRSAAIALFQKAAAARNSSGYTNLAMIDRDRSLRGDKRAIKQAVDNVHRALAVDSFNMDAYGTLATIVYDNAETKAKLEIARLICLQAIKQDANFATGYNVLGLVLLKMREVTRALRQFRRAAAIDPNYIDANMNIGAITLGFRDYRSAEAAFNRVLGLKPTKTVQFDAIVGLAVAYRGQRRFNEALDKYRSARRLNPDDVSVDYNIAILKQDYLFDGSKPDAGIKLLQEAQTLLERFVRTRGAAAKKHGAAVSDARRRLKNINELLQVLRAQKNALLGGKSGTLNG